MAELALKEALSMDQNDAMEIPQERWVDYELQISRRYHQLLHDAKEREVQEKQALVRGSSTCHVKPCSGTI